MTKDEFLSKVKEMIIQVEGNENFEFLIQMTEFRDAGNQLQEVVGNDIVCTTCAVCMAEVLQKHIEVNNLEHFAHVQKEKVH